MLLTPGEAFCSHLRHRPTGPANVKAVSDNSEKDAGAAEGTRTPDPIITNDVLYQLSYSGLWDRL